MVMLVTNAKFLCVMEFQQTAALFVPIKMGYVLLKIIVPVNWDILVPNAISTPAMVY